jgi:cobalamin-dependent methionine synthase I
MVIIGERINSTNKNVADAIEKKDESYIRKLAVEQTAAGRRIQTLLHR